ncbi:hypothetical protein EVAR_55031_1 [Eumeta japonica]|uniref:Uncharacterized protein n=1 Tax=Eumeta variegata TaxID=151549 RepID=A0A4C1ZUQ4_EUMVA|nr:hypothetical protein EVAR_55031_1 [Eumeta japonica]
MAVKRDHYVDDFICSTDSVPEAAKLISDVTIVHARGLRYPGWATNAPELKTCRRSRPRRPPPCHCTRRKQNGRWKRWEPECDSLGFDVTFKKLPRDIVIKIELHVFGDASEHAYAAVAYWRATTDGTVHLALVAGKSRVAPNKVMSIPRLELQAALWPVAYKGVKHARRVLWCDSKTVLRWIRSDPRAYKPFVAHRLAELDERSDRNEWRWVNSADNPRTTRARLRSGAVAERAHVSSTERRRVLLVDPPGAYVRRVLYFIRRLKQQQPFGADDVIDAETRLLRASQRRAFSDETGRRRGAATPEAVYGRWTSC